MSAALNKAINHWGQILPFTHIPRSKSEYQKLLVFVEELMKISRLNEYKHDERVSSLLQLIAKNIEEYENHYYPAKYVSPAELLKFLMEQHGLEQSDLPEIGSQSHVSKILSGERKLTVDHINRLSARFNISPAVFFDKQDRKFNFK